jgi:hypothetical protein
MAFLIPRNFAIFPTFLTKSPIQKGSFDVPVEIEGDPLGLGPLKRSSHVQWILTEETRTRARESRILGHYWIKQLTQYHCRNFDIQ